MDDRLITTLLQDIAEEEIPEDMPNLWPEIKKQLNTPPTRHVARLTRWGWAAAVIVLSLMLGAGVYALVQFSSNDAGMQQIQDENLVTPINESVTIDGITVTLDWAYADANRIALAYHYTQETVVTNDNEILAAVPLWPETLTDSEGHEFPMLFGGGGGGGGGGGSDEDEAAEPATISTLFEANSNYDASIIEGSPETLDLHFELSLGLQTQYVQTQPNPEDDSPTSGGGGGGGGGGEPSADEPLKPLTDAYEAIVGPFVLDFSVPFLPAVEIEPGTVSEHNGITMTLEAVSVTPSMTLATVCFTGIPDDDRQWVPMAILEDGTESLSSMGTGFKDAAGEGQQCYELMFLAAYNHSATTWNLTIDRLQFQLPPVEEELRAMFATYGIEIAFEESGAWYTTFVPEDVEDVGQVINDVLLSLADVIEGPWTFTIEVPAS